MPLDTTELLGAAITGALSGAVLGPLIAQRRERLDLRAAVLRNVSEVERTRWAGTTPYQEFRDAAIVLRASALVAGVPREVVESYVFLAQVARRASDDSWEMHGGELDGGAGGIASDLSDLARDAAGALVDLAWHPIRKRFSVRAALADIRQREARLRADEDERLPWDMPRL